MNGISGTILKPFVARSWFHPVGVLKVLNRIWDRLPDVNGRLFITFTIDPKLFADEASAFNHSRAHLRRVFHQLRQGVRHEGRTYRIDAPYCVKVEFHETGWVHYHVIFLTRRFVPAELLLELWDFGRINVKRITNSDFHYLLKYVTKSGDLPDWVKSRKRLRVFQTSRGFLRPLPDPAAAAPDDADESAEPKSPRASYTISQRLERWSRTAVLIRDGKVRTVLFQVPFRELFDQLVLPVALAGRYRGNGEVVINNKQELIQWLTQQNKPRARAT